MKIFYGTIKNNIDVTQICFDKLKKGNKIIIPNSDHRRASYFTDPLVGIEKKIIIFINGNITKYDVSVKVIINLTNSIITTEREDQNIISKINNKLYDIHNNLILKYGNFNEELPEQKMAIRYLTGNEKVLEIGGNIGRNSLIIGYILNKNNNNNLVTLESNLDIASQLIENRDINNLDFKIESSALSKRKLIQIGWNTIPSDILLDGYISVNTITFDELESKYNITFDTLVLDCEGAFYYILLDMPEILNNIKLIIMENDYNDINHKMHIDNFLIKNNFYVDYRESGGWGPCYNNFFEVWKKD